LLKTYKQTPYTKPAELRHALVDFIENGKIDGELVLPKSRLGILKNAVIFENKNLITLDDWKEKMLTLTEDGTPINSDGWANHRESAIFALMYNVRIFTIVNYSTGFNVFDSEKLLEERRIVFLRKVLHPQEPLVDQIFLYHHEAGSPFEATVGINNHYGILSKIPEDQQVLQESCFSHPKQYGPDDIYNFFDTIGSSPELEPNNENINKNTGKKTWICKTQAIR
jgi:hypothetical protein